MSEEKEWICIVCLQSITPEQMETAAQIELDAQPTGKLYFMRHGDCVMNREGRMRLVEQARMVGHDRD